MFVNDTLLFEWNPVPLSRALFVNPFSDAAGMAGVGLQVALQPVAALSVSAININGDSRDHMFFKVGEPNTLRVNLSRAIDSSHSNPIITVAPLNGTTSFAAYGGNWIDLVWTPVNVVSDARITFSVKDALGMLVNATTKPLKTLLPIPPPTISVRDSAGVNRAYAILSNSSTMQLAFQRSVAKILSFTSTVLPSGTSFLDASHVNSTAGLPATVYLAPLATGASAGIANFALSLEDENLLTYNFPSIALEIKPKLAAVGFTTMVNTRNTQYSAIRMDFNRDLVNGLGGLGLTGSSGVVANLSTSVGDFVFDYKTPNNASDVLHFVGVKDNAINDAETISFAVAGLYVSPVISAAWLWGVYPNSANYNYTGTHRAMAKFDNALMSVGDITASSGNDPTGEVVGADNTVVEFTWDTSASSNPCTLTFNGLVTTDGAVDAPPIEKATITFVYPPEFAAWGNQPTMPSTTYSGASAIRITLSKPLSVAPDVTSNLSGVIANVAVDGSTVSFDYTTPSDITSTELVFIIGSIAKPLIATDGSRSTSLAVRNGPVITDFNSTALPNTSNKVLNGVPYSHKLTFNRPLGATPILALVGGGSITSVVRGTNTLTFDVTAAAGTTAITVTGFTPPIASPSYLQDSGAGGVSTYALTVVQPASLSQLELASNPGIALAPASLLVNTAYSLLAAFSKTLNTSAVVPGVLTSAGSTPSTTAFFSADKLALAWTPNAASEPVDVVVTFTNVTDSDNFVRDISTAVDVRFAPLTVVAQTYPGQPSVGNNILSQASAQVISVQFSKSMSGAPAAASANATYTAGALSTTTIVNDTVAYTITNVSGTGDETMAFGTATAVDSSTTTGLSTTLARVTPLTVLRVAKQAEPSLQVTHLFVGVTQALFVIFTKDVSQLSGQISSAGITANTGANPGGLSIGASDRYAFSWTPNTEGSVSLTVTNVKDIHGFVTASIPAGPVIAVQSSLVFSLNANTDTHFTMSDTTVQTFTNPGVTGSTIVGGTISRNTLASGKKYLSMDGVTTQLAISSGPAFNEPFTLWMFAFWAVAPIAGGYPYVFAALNESLGNRGVLVRSTSAQIAAGSAGTSVTYAPLEINKWYHIALVSKGTNQTEVYMDGVLASSGPWYADGSVRQITLNNYAMNTTSSFNSNMRVGAMGLTREALSASALASMKADLAVDFGLIA
jgi:hypothetical protein